MLDELDLYIKDKEGDEFVLPFLISFKIKQGIFLIKMITQMRT